MKNPASHILFTYNMNDKPIWRMDKTGLILYNLDNPK